MHSRFAITIGSFRGITIRANWSLLVIFGLLVWGLAEGGLPELAAGYTRAEYWAAALGTTALFFVSLLMHEVSHSVVARRFGIEVEGITLWLLGGVSEIKSEPGSPGEEFRVAVAGPATSVAVAAGVFAFAVLGAVVSAPDLALASLVWLASVNLVLAVFNMVPAAPLDGGRVLRAIVWWRTGDRVRAEVSAARAGTVFGYVLVALGLVELFAGGGIGGLWLVLLGWFLVMVSRAEETQARVGADLAGVRVADVMTPSPVTVGAATSVDDVLHDYVMRHHCSSFPVVDRSGSVTGLVTLTQLRAVSRERRPVTTAGQVAVPAAEVPRAAPGEPLLDVLRRVAGTGRDRAGGRMLVWDDDRLAGIVSPTDVARAIDVAELRRAG